MSYSGTIGSAGFQPGQIEPGLGSWQIAASEDLLPSVLLQQTQIQPVIAAEDVSLGVLALLPPGSGSYPIAILADSPRGYFKLDEPGTPTTYVDSSGNGRTGTASGSLTNGVTPLSGLLPGTAVGFNGGTITTTAAGGTADQLTVEAWVKTTSSNGYVLTSRQGSYSTGDCFTLGMGSAPVYGSPGHPFIGLDNGGVWSGIQITAANTVNDNQWHQLVGTWKGVAGTGINWDQFKMYVDGVLVPTQNVQYNTPTAASNQVTGFCIGTNGFVGSIDEVAIYGVELTAARLLAHYVAGTTYLLSLPVAAVTEDQSTFYASMIPGDLVVASGAGLPRYIEALQTGATLHDSTLSLTVMVVEDFTPVVIPDPLMMPVVAADFNTSVVLSTYRSFQTGVDDIEPAVDTSSWWQRNNVASATGGVVTLINWAGGSIATLIETDSTTYTTPSVGGPPLVLSAELGISGSADEMIFGFLPSTTPATWNSDILWNAPGFYGVSLDIWNGPSIWCVDNGSGRTQQTWGIDPRSADFEWWIAVFTAISSTQMTIELRRGATSVRTWTVSKPSYTAMHLAFGARTGGASGLWRVRGVEAAAGASRPLRSPGEDLATYASLTPLLFLPTATAVEDLATSVLTVLGYVNLSGSGDLNFTGCPAAIGSLALDGSGGINTMDLVTWINLSGSGSLTTVGVKPFSPNVLPGLHLWLRAKDNVGASGSAVTTWVDQSGAGHDGIEAGVPAPTVVAGATPSGGRAVQFGAAGYFNLGAVMSSGVIVTASSEYGAGAAGYAAINVIDGNTGTRWVGATGSVPEWLQIQMPVSIATPTISYTISGYAPEPAGTPSSWTFAGSNDAAMWTTLDTQTGIAFVGNTPQTFIFTNTTVYRYYQLNVTATQSPDYVRVSEFSLNNMPTNAVSDGELWAVVKADTVTQGRAFLSASTGAYGQYYPTGGQVYEEFGTNYYRSFYPTLPVTTWRIYRVTATVGGAWQAWLDGFSQSSVTGNTVNWRTNWVLGARTAGGSPFAGFVGEILVRSQISTPQEVTAITSYLFGQHIQVNDLGAVTMTALEAINLHLPQMDIGGISSLDVSPAITVTVGQPGTLANPYPRADTATSSVNFTQAILVAAEPVALTGPAAAPSIWFKFTESQIANLTASTSGFANGATIDLYSGPDNAAPGDLTLIATNGVLAVVLGAVTVDASPVAAVSPFQVSVIDLGVVTIMAVVAVAPQQAVDVGLIALTTVVTVASQRTVDLGVVTLTTVIVMASQRTVDLGAVNLTAAVVVAPQQAVNLGAIAVNAVGAITISSWTTAIDLGVVVVTTAVAVAPQRTVSLGVIVMDATPVVTLSGMTTVQNLLAGSGSLVTTGTALAITGTKILSGDGTLNVTSVLTIGNGLPLAGDGALGATGVKFP